MELLPAPAPVKPWRGPRTPGRRSIGPERASLWGALAVVLLPMAACESEPTELPPPRFAQVGEVEVEVISPIAGGEGTLEEAFRWRSEGPWVLAERMRYQGLTGDESVRRPTLNPGDLAPEYASLVQQLNETPGLRLFDAQVPQSLRPECGEGRSRVTFTLRDSFRDEMARWVRCADGTFFSLSPATAGPDAGAARVITAAQLARFFTLGEGAISTYFGSRPFYRLDRGEDSPARPEASRVFRSESAEPPEGWLEFWEAHAGATSPRPAVDWTRDMVILASVGTRPEAGETVTVRRILPIAAGVRIETVWRVPGDFCSPAAKEIHPYDLVVAPKGATPIEFNEPVVERVPCGV